MTQGGQTASRADNYHVYLNINSVNKTAVVLSICGQEFIDENPCTLLLLEEGIMHILTSTLN